MYPNGQQGPGQGGYSPEQPNPQQANSVQPTQQPQAFGSTPDGGIFEVKPPQKDKKKALLIAIFVSLGVAILVAAALLYIFLVVMKDAPEVEEEKPTDLKSSTFIQQVREGIEKQYPKENIIGSAAPTMPALATEDAVSAPAYQPDGYQYRTLYDNDAAFTYEITAPPVQAPATEGDTAETPATPPAKDDDEVKKDVNSKDTTVSTFTMDLFKEAELDVISREANADDAGTETVKYMYSGRGIVCVVEAVNNEKLEKGTVSCGDIAEYKKTAAEIQPFADSLTNTTSQTVLKYLSTAPSEAGGYQKATLTVVNPEGKEMAAYFYKKDAGRWLHLTTSADELLSCAIYSTIEMQRSYLNTPCKNAQGTTSKVVVIEKR